VQAREGFDQNRLMDSSSKEVTDAVAYAEDVAQILRHNIVQGRKEEGKNVLSMALRRMLDIGS
jgi:hypothetical protein